MYVPRLAVTLFLLITVLPFCSPKRVPPAEKRKVFIDHKAGKFTLFRNGHPFFIKGGSGYTHLATLHESGGNTIRVWDTANLGRILDEAEANHLAVVVGLPFHYADALSFYDADRLLKQYKALQKVVHTYKYHPALLMWCVGNELYFPFNLRYNDFYSAFGDIVDMIHVEDPDHPVTTTILNVHSKYIFNVLRKSNVDLISLNVFNKLPDMKRQIDGLTWFWKGPYLLTEWGIDGPWSGTAFTAWGAYIENSSTKKAEMYRERYEKAIAPTDPRLLGSLVFYWGQKQEYTHTWFSMFDEEGNRSESVSLMQYLWTGKFPDHMPPQINYMLIEKKGAPSDLMFNPAVTVHAEVVLLQPDSNITRVKWELLPEDWYHTKEEDIKPVKPPPIEEHIKAGEGLTAEILTPSVGGPYRLFAKLYDKFGNFSTCNIPFYVVKDP
ncbi:hypothetical protein Q4E93_18240 [Flavitalea sp. BT771]|uniref:hypothetical protein n=1 Tax=Flavitalea sp. BT771 TaxID=3063329 RepID=UPI0026E2E54D|nr:hypothetical protein [Flavitalea sp. BT771]MDO6432551.1 hypothetical protein [Flavitalea sp. BT771]MDV6221460.1 hypothetical protein [Flavitalea sp. BT771]